MQRAGHPEMGAHRVDPLPSLALRIIPSAASDAKRRASN
jgi:hypothetical protein